MPKKILRKFIRRFGYDFVKTPHTVPEHTYRRKSNLPGADYFETPTGNYYLPKQTQKDFVAMAVKRGEVFDKPVMDIISAAVQPGTSILDVGANYGQMSVLLSKLHDGSCTVYSFEAQKMVYDILEKNLAANQCRNVKAYYNAVYDRNGETLIFPEPDLVRFSSYGSYGIDPTGSSGIPVTSITIDSIDFSKPVSFIKVDIQGSDIFALRGAEQTIRKYRMPVIFEYEEGFQEEFGTSFQDYVDFVNHIGYKFVKTIQEINYLIIPK